MVEGRRPFVIPGRLRWRVVKRAFIRPILIEPDTFELHTREGKSDLKSLGIIKSDIAHIRLKSNPDALNWAWNKWSP